MKIAVFWFRRDLRIEDNTALSHALHSGLPVLPIFIFDHNIIDELPADDARISFIYERLLLIRDNLRERGGRLRIYKGDPIRVWENIISVYNVGQVYMNRDYEPYAIDRDKKIGDLLSGKGIGISEYRDQVIFEGSEIVKDDGKPYTVFTPYKKKWLSHFPARTAAVIETPYPGNFFLDGPDISVNSDFSVYSLSDIGFRPSTVRARDYDLSVADQYAATRDLPGEDATSYLGPHLRFGTVSVRQVISQLQPQHEVFLSELIWREFFMQILYHFPKVVDKNFHAKYDGIQWRNNPDEFETWCRGETGYPMVDAGMRQLNETGFMHNRVRMVTASFLCKHLLIDWRWGEAYFAEKLLDYELSSNNGNWQWAAGTGCDAAPYFRVFNPSEQLKKFDSDLTYVKKWVPGYDPGKYIEPMVDHRVARERALEAYKKGLQQNWTG